MLTMSDVDLADRRVLIREDLNVPLAGGRVADDARIRAALPTLRRALEAGARVLVVSHLGRPEEGHYEEAFSLAPVAAALGAALGREVPLARDWLAGVDVAPGQCVLCENVRFEVGEKADDEDLARRMAALCDVFVNDAFATAHRAQASTHGIARFAPVACAGPLLAREIETLHAALEAPARPLVAIVGGAKVSTKLTLLHNLAGRIDQLVVGGGIANTFLKAAGHPVGRSLCEDALLPEAKALLEDPAFAVPLPTDVVCATACTAEAEATVRLVDEVRDDEQILDVGPRSRARIAEVLAGAGTIVWNGPLGVFELPQFAEGTRALAEAIARSEAFSIAGGGDTVAAIARFGVADRISYISTGGGAFLEYLEGRTLPAVRILAERAGDTPRR